MGSNSVDILVRDLSVYGQVALGLLLMSLVTDGVLSNRYRDGGMHCSITGRFGIWSCR